MAAIKREVGLMILENGRGIDGRTLSLRMESSRIGDLEHRAKLLGRPGAPPLQGFGAKSKVWPLDGALVTPGLWDSHLHLYLWAQTRSYLDMSLVRHKSDLLALVEAAAFKMSTGPTLPWLLGKSMNPGLGGLADRPCRYHLDALTGARPAFLWGSDLHSGLANTAALQAADLLGLDVHVEGGVIDRDSKGEPTGWLHELALGRVMGVIPRPSDKELEVLLLEAQAELHSIGVTGVCDQRMKDQDELLSLLRALRCLQAQGLWRLRTTVNIAIHQLDDANVLELLSGLEGDRLRAGHVKMFADGTLGSKTARMLTPLLGGGKGADGRGVYLTPPAKLWSDFFKAAQAGWPISVHAIGDEANRVCLDGFERLRQAGFTDPRLPHRIEHAQVLQDKDVERFAELNIVASVQPGHLLDDRKLADHLLGRRASKAYRWRTLKEKGATVIFGTDAPVSSIDPRYGMRAAIARGQQGEPSWYPHECLGVPEVWQAYTEGPAKALGWGDLTGKLTPGYRADLVVWEGDPTKLHPAQGKAAVQATFFDGELVFLTRAKGRLPQETEDNRAR